jgi:hypothetical protein
MVDKHSLMQVGFCLCLSHAVVLSHDATDRVVFRGQKFIPHRSGGWDAHDQGAGIWWGPLCVLKMVP